MFKLTQNFTYNHDINEAIVFTESTANEPWKQCHTFHETLKDVTIASLNKQVKASVNEAIFTATVSTLKL